VNSPKGLNITLISIIVGFFFICQIVPLSNFNYEKSTQGGTEDPIVYSSSEQSTISSGTRGITDPIPRDGDWYIEGWEQLTSTSYILRGNLTINSSATLVLINTTIIFDPDSGVPYGVIVEPGGTLNTTDLDNDVLTKDDYSAFRINETKLNSSSFSFHARAGSNLLMKNTFLRFGNLADDSNGGVVISSEGTEIKNCQIENAQIGLTLDGSNSSFIENVEFTNIAQTAVEVSDTNNTLLVGLNLSDGEMGVKIIDSVNILIKDSEFQSNKIGVQIINSNDIELNNIQISQSNTIGLNLINAKNIIVIDSELVKNKQGIFSAASSVSLYDSFLENNSEGSDFQNTTGFITGNFWSNNSSLKLTDGTDLMMMQIRPLPENSSNFWTDITVDGSSEFRLVVTFEFSFIRPENFSLPSEGNYTITNRIGAYTSDVITMAVTQETEVPLRNIGGKLEWFDPYNIRFETGGYFLNETFSLFEGNQFEFQLNYNSPPILKNASVEPDRGDTKTTFTFTVEYRDADGDPPLFVNLIIENLSLAMVRQDDDGLDSPSGGIIFRLEFSALDDGHNTYYFETDDGRGYLNSRTLLIPSNTLDVKPLDSDEDGEEESDYVFIFLTLCIVMLFVFVVFVIAMNYMMQKKMSKAGGVPPGTLPEEMYEDTKKELVICSECGSEIDASVDKCPHCGEVFEGEEFQCPKCDNIVPESASMCPNCGNKFMDLKEDLSDEKKVKEPKTQIVDKLYCSECGAVVDEDMTECPGCGENFEGEIEDEDSEGGIPPDKTVKRRTPPKKGKSVEDNDMTFICSVCGASVRDGDNKCPECHTEFE
jgi:RNA polymerase subunit RPABC4/transcription elongation factor Spt4